jgi:hypothetical protein
MLTKCDESTLECFRDIIKILKGCLFTAHHELRKVFKDNKTDYTVLGLVEDTDDFLEVLTVGNVAEYLLFS